MQFISDADREAAEKNGIDYKNLYNRVHACGWPLERAITEPIKPKPGSLYQDYKHLAEPNGITAQTFYKRIKRGMTPEKAATTPKITIADIRRAKNIKAKITPEIIEIAAKNGITERALKQRVYSRKWSLERAMTEPLQKPGEWRKHKNATVQK